MEDFDNQTRYVKYSSFNVGNETSNYSVTLHGYSGNVGKNFFEFKFLWWNYFKIFFPLNLQKKMVFTFLGKTAKKPKVKQNWIIVVLS